MAVNRKPLITYFRDVVEQFSLESKKKNAHPNSAISNGVDQTVFANNIIA